MKKCKKHIYTKFGCSSNPKGKEAMKLHEKMMQRQCRKIGGVGTHRFLALQVQVGMITDGQLYLSRTNMVTANTVRKLTQQFPLFRLLPIYSEFFPISHTNGSRSIYTRYDVGQDKNFRCPLHPYLHYLFVH